MTYNTPRLPALALASLLAVPCAAAAQVEVDTPPAGVELGVYTGGSYTTDWFTTPGADEAQEWRPGYAPAFGVTAQLWFEPRVGVRLHAAYLPQNLPGGGGLDQRLRVVNSYLYDVDLVVRPFALSTPNTLLQTVYLFLGGGGYTADVADFMSPVEGGCVPQESWTPAGVCVPTDAGQGTTGMAVAGGGISLARISSRVEAFGEAAVHVYDSPAHVTDNASGEDRISFTPRAVIGLKVSARPRGVRMPEPAPEPVAPLPPPAVVVEPEPTPVRPAAEEIQVCVLQDAALARVTVTRDPATGDTTVGGVPFGQAFPDTAAALAANAAWYAAGEPIAFQGRRFVKFGDVRVLDVGDVARVGEFRGVPLFAAPAARVDVLYVPVRHGCEFQPYAVELKTGRIR
ncbi:MAG TPA: hypothetical protein VGB66_08630 [Longimicrobium sp.]